MKEINGRLLIGTSNTDKIVAIKYVFKWAKKFALTGMGLKECKRFVEGRFPVTEKSLPDGKLYLLYALETGFTYYDTVSESHCTIKKPDCLLLHKGATTRRQELLGELSLLLQRQRQIMEELGTFNWNEPPSP